MSIDPRERQRILEIAREVRRHVRKASGVHCSPDGLCGEASLALSVRLTRAQIPHEIWGGLWKGPISVEGEAWNVEQEAGWADPHLLHGAHRQHTWIVFPQHDGAVLDVTADQFHKVPGIWFPAREEWYERNEKFDPKDIFEAATMGTSFIVKKDDDEGESRHIGDPIIPLSGPRFRRPPKGLKVRVREHLKRPPRSCLCHKSKTVDRARRGLVRRLK